VPAVNRGILIVGFCAALAGGSHAAPGTRRAPSTPAASAGQGLQSPPAPGTCALFVTPLSFRTVSGDTTTTATITVTCPARLPYAIALHIGQHGDTTSRKIRAGGAQILDYELYQDAGRRVVWGDRGFANTYPRGEVKAAIGTGMAQAHLVFAALHVPPKTALPAGTYTDALIVTVHF